MAQEEARAQAVPGPKPRWKRILERALGKRMMDLLSPYDAHLLWNVALPAYLPASCAGLSVLEVGSAPGDFLVRFAKTFGVIPYGVEYTRRGAELNRRTFEAAGLDPANVIEADFFSEEFAREYRDRFDIVFSRGFIEHFRDPERVLAQHVAVLKPGGLLVVMIPKLNGVYYPWTRMFNAGILPMHNLEIMKLDRFRALFENLPVTLLRCSYFGTFSFWMFTAPPDARGLNRVVALLIRVQRVLNVSFRVLFDARGCESALFSPNLVFFGRKCGCRDG